MEIFHVLHHLKYRSIAALRMSTGSSCTCSRKPVSTGSEPPFTGLHILWTTGRGLFLMRCDQTGNRRMGYTKSGTCLFIHMNLARAAWEIIRKFQIDIITTWRILFVKLPEISWPMAAECWMPKQLRLHPFSGFWTLEDFAHHVGTRRGIDLGSRFTSTSHIRKNCFVWTASVEDNLRSKHVPAIPSASSPT